MVSDKFRRQTSKGLASLNPCCNGIWSRTATKDMICTAASGVLILVVMEYGLGQKDGVYEKGETIFGLM